MNAFRASRCNPIDAIVLYDEAKIVEYRMQSDVHVGSASISGLHGWEIVRLNLVRLLSGKLKTL